CIFFFSSRRRHTRFSRDWSSDVCSSDLASVGYKNFLFLDATVRNDWSSTLPVNNNSFTYPSITGSFVFSDLEGLKNLEWLSFGKIRLGWAQVGNDTEPYQLYKVYEAQQPIDGKP